MRYYVWVRRKGEVREDQEVREPFVEPAVNVPTGAIIGCPWDAIPHESRARHTPRRSFGRCPWVLQRMLKRLEAL